MAKRRVTPNDHKSVGGDISTALLSSCDTILHLLMAGMQMRPHGQHSLSAMAVHNAAELLTAAPAGFQSLFKTGHASLAPP